MRLLRRPISACFYRSIPFALALAGSVRGEVSLNRLHIDRWTQAGEPSGIDASLVQRIGEKLGAGHFLVANIALGEEGASSAEPVRLFSFYSTASPGHGQLPKGQLLFLPDDHGGVLTTGSADKLLAAFISHPSVAKATDEQISEFVAVVLSSTLFGGKGSWLNTEKETAFGFVLPRETATRTWKGIYLREDGASEEVTVTFAANGTNEVELSQCELHSSGSIPPATRNDFPFEEWTVDGDAHWHPSQRYKMMTTMAALGNATKQFQLATALLQEPGDDAKAEGMKWLRAAAAQGHRDAIALLRQSGEELERPDRDRDKVRVSRCCPVPGR